MKICVCSSRKNCFSALRRGVWLFLALILHAGASSAATAPAADSPRMTPVVRAVQTSAPAVVNITSTYQVESMRSSPLELFFGPGLPGFGALDRQPVKQRRTSLGSGIIVDGGKGLVLTNAHVIAGGGEIMVRLQDGREFAATVRGADSDFDLAVLEIAGAKALPSVGMGDSDDLMPG